MQALRTLLILGYETKPPILQWDKTADFENATKSPNLMRQNRRFVKIQIASLGSDESCSR